MQTPQSPAPPGLNLILGDSAGGIFVRNYGRENLLVDHDVLSCGPTARCEDFATWNAMRLEYWTTLLPGERQYPPSLNISDDAERLRTAECINIWAATSLSEQLFIAFVLHVIDTLGIDPARLRLVQFEHLRGRPRARVLGMGELNEANMADHPEPVPFTREALEDYRAAWAALTAPDPTQIERFAESRPNASGHLKQAMQLMLRRFPDARSGLPYWDHVLLGKVRDRGPRVARVIGSALTDCMEDGDLVGDWYLLGRLLRMSDERLPKPLVAITADQSNLFRGETTLTPFGIEVLEGRTSSYPTNPIQDWAAGVRLSSSEGRLWFSDSAGIGHVAE